MKYLAAASSEVNALLTLLKVSSQNGDIVRAEMVTKTYKNIAKIYANNAQRSTQASCTKLEELLDALTVEVLKSTLKAKEVNANRLAESYAIAAKARIVQVDESIGGDDVAEVELNFGTEAPEAPEAE